MGLGIVLAWVLGFASSSLGQELLDGDARFSFDGEFNDFEAEPGNDRLLQHIWFWRIQGGPRENEFDTSTASTVIDPAGDRVEHAFSLPDFEATLATQLVDSSMPGQAFASQGITVTNTSPSPFTLHVYAYDDYSLGGSETAIFINPGTFIEVTDPVTQNRVSTDALLATAYQVEPYPLLLDLLRDASPTPLSNSGIPFTGGDFTSAFQWSFPLAPGETRTVFLLYFIDGDVAPPADLDFRRGDANGDGVFDISDAVFTLAALFQPGSGPFGCPDAADGNDDGAVDITDAVFALAQLFSPAPPPPLPPGPTDCGPDPTADAIDCPTYTGC